MTAVTVPKESVSDDSYLVASLSRANGDRVSQGEIVAALETSKAAFELEAPCDGFVFYAARVGDRVVVGDTLATISPHREPSPPVVKPMPAAAAGSPGIDATRFSKAAEKLLAEHGVDRGAFAGRDLVRAEEVEAYLRSRNSAPADRPADLLLDLPPIRPAHVLLIGAGGHAKVCIEILRLLPQFELYGLLDERLALGASVLGVPVIGRDSAMPELRARGLTQAVLGIGAVLSHASRAGQLERLRRAGFVLPTLVHPQASVDASAKLGDGNVVFAQATVSADVTIGHGCIINSGAVVSHDCSLGSNVHLAPGALLAGGVQVGDDTLIGMGATIFLNVRIGRAVCINNGVHVDRHVADGTVLKR